VLVGEAVALVETGKVAVADVAAVNDVAVVTDVALD